MRPLFNTAALLTVASVASVATAETILIQWAKALLTGEEMTSASLNGSIIATTCDRKLVLGKIEFEVDADSEARGLITVETPEHRFTYDLSEEETCSGFWNSEFAEIRCNIPLQGESNLHDAPMMELADSCFPLAGRSEGALFPFDPNEDDFVDEQHANNDTTGVSSASTVPSPTSIPDRRACFWVTQTRTRNPRTPQMYRRHIQLTPSLECGKGSCTIGKSQTYTATHTATFSHSSQWINGGFSVSRSRSSTFSITCVGKQNERICIRHMRRYQGYDTDEGLINTCGGSSWRKGGQQRSPLKSDAQAKYYCARGGNDCRDDGWVAMHHVGPGIHKGA